MKEVVSTLKSQNLTIELGDISTHTKMSFLFGSCRVKAFRDFPSHFTPLWKCHLSIIINSPSSREDSQSYFKNGFNSTKKATSTIHENSLEEEIRDEDPFQ